MNCEVSGVKNNMRYRILIIGSRTFVLDMGNALWKIIFPPFFWIFSNAIYEVNDTDLVEKIKTPAMKQTLSAGDSILGGIVAIFLANLLRPLGDYFDLPSNS